jgi:hypothetical protein
LVFGASGWLPRCVDTSIAVEVEATANLHATTAAFSSPAAHSRRSPRGWPCWSPANPVQVCTVNNASGTIEDANVTNVEVLCV